ncbi:MAG: hypothetical protein Q9162_001079 [Coniocarpon cinnabarinum]
MSECTSPVAGTKKRKRESDDESKSKRPRLSHSQPDARTKRKRQSDHESMPNKRKRQSDLEHKPKRPRLTRSALRTLDKANEDRERRSAENRAERASSQEELMTTSPASMSGHEFGVEIQLASRGVCSLDPSPLGEKSIYPDDIEEFKNALRRPRATPPPTESAIADLHIKRSKLSGQSFVLAGLVRMRDVFWGGDVLVA